MTFKVMVYKKELCQYSVIGCFCKFYQSLIVEAFLPSIGDVDCRMCFFI